MNQELWALAQEIRDEAPRRPRVTASIQSRRLIEWAHRIEAIAAGNQLEDGQPHDRRGQWDGMPGAGV